MKCGVKISIEYNPSGEAWHAEIRTSEMRAGKQYGGTLIDTVRHSGTYAAYMRKVRAMLHKIVDECIT